METVLIELSREIEKLQDSSAKITYLEGLLKKTKEPEKKDAIKKLIAQLEKSIEEENKKKKIAKANAELEAILSGREKRAVRAVEIENTKLDDLDLRLGPVQEKKDTIIVKNDELSEKAYGPADDYKAPGIMKEKPVYLNRLEDDMVLRGTQQSNSIDPTAPQKDYEPNKESEEYKRNQQLDNIIKDTRKKEEEQKEYMRKKMMDLI